jgi:excisionase family DNA binding protein
MSRRLGARGESYVKGPHAAPDEEPVMAVTDRVIDIRDHPRAPEPEDAAGVSQLAVWLSGQQAAEHVGVSWPTLRQFIIDHRIPHVRLGRRWKIEVAVLDHHLRQLADGRR